MRDKELTDVWLFRLNSVRNRTILPAPRHLDLLDSLKQTKNSLLTDVSTVFSNTCNIFKIIIRETAAFFADGWPKKMASEVARLPVHYPLLMMLHYPCVCRTTQ